MEDYKSTRKITRRELNTDIRLKIHESSKKDVRILEDYIKAKTNDISENGLGVYAPVYLPEGTCLEIELDGSSLGSSGKGPVYIVGKVTSSIMGEGGYRIGIQFVEVSEKDRTSIRSYIQS